MREGERASSADLLMRPSVAGNEDMMASLTSLSNHFITTEFGVTEAGCGGFVNRIALTSL